MYVAFNSHNFAVKTNLPEAKGGSWGRLVDTNLSPPQDFSAAEHPLVSGTYNLQPHSSIILITK